MCVCNPDSIFNESSGPFPPLPALVLSAGHGLPTSTSFYPFKHILWKFEQFRDASEQASPVLFHKDYLCVQSDTVVSIFPRRVSSCESYSWPTGAYFYHFCLNFPKLVFRSPGLTSAQPDGPFPLFDQE